MKQFKAKNIPELGWWDNDFVPEWIEITKGCRSSYCQVIIDTGKKIRISNKSLKRLNLNDVIIAPRRGNTYKLLPTKSKNLFRLIWYANVLHYALKKGDNIMIIGSSCKEMS